jgi:Ca2+-binding EF-hand superfamily protein
VVEVTVSALSEQFSVRWTTTETKSLISKNLSKLSTHMGKLKNYLCNRKFSLFPKKTDL